MSHHVTVKIWEPIHQAYRTIKYEIPLASALRSHGAGEITGVNAAMTRELEVESAEFEMILADLDKAVELVKLVLEEAGAPSGSEIRFSRDEKDEIVRFGRKEGLAVYLDGINLPDEVYDTCSCDGLAALIFEALTSVGGEILGSWVGRSETSIYLYGPDAEIMFSVIEPILTAYPLCQNARIVIRHGNPALHPHTVRLPFHDKPGIRQVYWGGVKGNG
jgi:hypothetical protein